MWRRCSTLTHDSPCKFHSRSLTWLALFALRSFLFSIFQHLPYFISVIVFFILLHSFIHQLPRNLHISQRRCRRSFFYPPFCPSYQTENTLLVFARSDIHDTALYQVVHPQAALFWYPHCLKWAPSWLRMHFINRIMLLVQIYFNAGDSGICRCIFSLFSYRAVIQMHSEWKWCWRGTW